MRKVTSIALALAFVMSVASASAATPCRDAKGKFVKCAPAATASVKPTKCRDIKTKKFAKCGAPGTEPVPAKG